MCKRSYQSKMCYHFKFGHWIGLRAVIVLDHSFVYNLSTKHMQDFQICRVCDQKYGECLDYLWRDKSMIAKYRVHVAFLALRIESVGVAILASTSHDLHTQPVQLFLRRSLLSLQQEPEGFGARSGAISEGRSHAAIRLDGGVQSGSRALSIRG